MDFHRHAQRDKKLESPKEKAMAPHSSTPAWKIPWTEGPGRLQSMGSLRVRHDWATSLSLFTFIHWRRKWQPTPVFLPGESQGRGAWWAAVYGVAQSWTWLKRLSSSSSFFMAQLSHPGDFPDSLAGRESACNAGDPRLFPGMRRSPGEGIGYPLQYPWASLVIQLIKNLPAMQETWVWSLHWDNPLEKGTATHSSILAWRIPWTV